MSRETLGEHLDRAQPCFLTKRKDVHTQTSTAALFRRAHYRPAAGKGADDSAPARGPGPAAAEASPPQGLLRLWLWAGPHARLTHSPLCAGSCPPACWPSSLGSWHPLLCSWEPRQEEGLGVLLQGHKPLPSCKKVKPHFLSPKWCKST